MQLFTVSARLEGGIHVKLGRNDSGAGGQLAAVKRQQDVVTPVVRAMRTA